MFWYFSQFNIRCIHIFCASSTFSLSLSFFSQSFKNTFLSLCGIFFCLEKERFFTHNFLFVSLTSRYLKKHLPKFLFYNIFKSLCVYKTFMYISLKKKICPSLFKTKKTQNILIIIKTFLSAINWQDSGYFFILIWHRKKHG